MVTPAPTIDKLEEITHQLNFNNDIYILTMKTIPYEKIHFNIRQVNNISFYYYEKDYDYEEITKILLLQRNYYDNINKIFKFYDTALKRNKVSLTQDKQKKIMILSLKKVLDFDEIECCLNLIEKKITNEEMITILFNEIKEMKLNQNKRHDYNINNINNYENNENNEMIQTLIKKNEQLEKKINFIIDENIKLKNSISELKNTLEEINKKNNKEEKEEKEEKKEKEIFVEEEVNFKMQNIDINFYGNPELLTLRDTITNNNSNSGWLREFALYTRLTDNVEYLVYNNKNSYNLDVIRLKDKKLVHYLKGHKDKVSVIRYFVQKNIKEYLLSCDESRIVFCWDIQNFSQKFKIHTNYSGYIWDALILFNIRENNYIFLPSNSTNEYTKIYEFNDLPQFVKNIYNTNENKTNYILPWYYNNNYYLIECCNSKISINNILKDEHYATLSNEPEGLHCCGYIFNDNFLCVTDYNNNLIRIWDLINKSIFSEIYYESNLAYGIIPWNDNYSIVACSGCLVIIDLKQKRMVNKISFKKLKPNFCGIKKIKLSNLGECVVCSDVNNSIRLFNLKNI